MKKSYIKTRVGFMQGRLCRCVDGKVQAFPWHDWESEFPVASVANLHIMEWTLDQERLYENPLMTSDGQEKIRTLCKLNGVSIPSLTGDCFMQAPFWKVFGNTRSELKASFLEIASACFAVGIGMMIVPLVDNGRLDTIEQENVLIDFLLGHQSIFAENKLQVIFESDFSPNEMVRFISRLPHNLFGINYDIGNSAALGFNPIEEFAAYGSRILNVHIKDRVLGGKTVPLGTGSADFDSVFSLLSQHSYQGNFILQTARAENEKHSEILIKYRDMTCKWIKQFHSPASSCSTRFKTHPVNSNF